MTLKDLLKIIIKYSIVLSFALIIVGIVTCFTGIGAIIGIPMIFLGLTVMQSKKHLTEIVNGENITKSLFLYFKKIKIFFIIFLVYIICLITLYFIGGFYFKDLLNNTFI